MWFVLFFYSSLIVSAGELSDIVNVEVMESEQRHFANMMVSWGDEIIGPGASPRITEQDIRLAIQQEFTNEQAALNQLNVLKQQGIKINVKFNYFIPNISCYLGETRRSLLSPYERNLLDEKCNKEKPQAGALQLTCEKQTPSSMPERIVNGQTYPRHDFYISDATEPDSYRDHMNSTGTFLQFKWASKEQIGRHIASCLATLDGMPKLKPKNPSDPVKIEMNNDIYRDFQSWFNQKQDIRVSNTRDGRFRQAVDCLYKSALPYFQDRTGNIIVLQKSSNEYSLAIMDKSSWRKLSRNGDEDLIQNKGLWPNVQATSVSELMTKIFKQDLNVNLDTCLMSSGLKLFDPNQINKSIADPNACLEQTPAPVRSAEQKACDEGQAEACLKLAKNYLENKSKCSSDDMSINCLMTRLDLDQYYFNKACSLGSNEGCSAISYRYRISPFTTKEIENKKRSCQSKQALECFFWNKNISPPNAQERIALVKKCENQSSFNNKDCIEIAMVNAMEGNLDATVDFIRKSCPWNTFPQLQNNCFSATDLLQATGHESSAIKILEPMCAFAGNPACLKLYQLYDQNQQDALIKRICWDTKTKCF